MVEELRPRRADSSEFVASCVDCGAHAHGWHRLLANARVFAALGDADRLIVQHTHACAVCGGDTLVVVGR